MRKSFLLLAIFSTFTCGSLQIYAQSKTEFNFGVGLIFGSYPTGGFEFNADILKKSEKKYNSGFTIGLGLLFPWTTAIVGENYNGTIAQAFSEDVYEEGLTRDMGIYLSSSYHFGRIAIGGRIGSYTTSEYQNAFNNQMGLYNVTYTGGEYILYGGFTEVRITPNIGVTGGYDNYSLATLGANYRF